MHLFAASFVSILTVPRGVPNAAARALQLPASWSPSVFRITNCFCSNASCAAAASCCSRRMILCPCAEPNVSAKLWSSNADIQPSHWIMSDRAWKTAQGEAGLYSCILFFRQAPHISDMLQCVTIHVLHCKHVSAVPAARSWRLRIQLNPWSPWSDALSFGLAWWYSVQNCWCVPLFWCATDYLWSEFI